MTPEIAGRVEQLRRNTVSGAVELATLAIGIALDAPDEWPELARAFQSMHPAIVTVANVGRLLAASTPADLVALRRSLAEGNSRITSHVAALVLPGARVVTISYSSTVVAALLAAKPAQVYALESLPGGEGHALAAKLGATVVPDAAMGRIVPLVDCALVGIDAFDRAGAILHKAGTLPLALCCAHFHKPFYAAGHSFKLAPVDAATLLENAGPAGEKFDRTPPELITALITERGAWGGDAAAGS